MAISLKQITGKIVVPGTTTGIRAKVTATPLTTASALTFSGDNTISWGPVVAVTNAAGQLPTAFKIPTNSDQTEVFWRIVAEPVDRPAGVPKSWTMGNFQLTGTGTEDLADLVEVDLTAVDPALVVTVQGLVTQAEESEANAAASATSAEGFAEAALDSAADADASADAADVSEANAASSASTATTQAGIATTKAGEASTSATAAASSATAASGSATSASTSATTATNNANGFGIGTTTTGAAGSSAAATITGTAPTRVLNLTIPRGDQGLPGPGSAAWTAAQAVVVGSVRQSPTGEWIRSTAARTTGASYDATEAGFWAFTAVPTILSPAIGSTEVRTVNGPRTTKWRESFARGSVTEGATTLENMTWGWGFNMTANYAKEVATEPMFRIGIESSWLNGGSIFTEFHLNYIDPGTTTVVRPLGVDIVQGGDGGKGSPRVSFTISDTIATGSWAVYNVANDVLMAFASSAWNFKRSVGISRGSSAESAMTIGDHLHDASLYLDSKHSGGAKTNAINILRDGAFSWIFYDEGGSTDFSFRDATNSRTHLYLHKGSTAELARTDIESQLRVKSSVVQIGPSQEVSVGTLGTSEGWLSSTSALNIRSLGGLTYMKSSTMFQGSQIGFYSTTPASKQTVSGSRSGNAALASAISALATIGLVTDATTV